MGEECVGALSCAMLFRSVGSVTECVGAGGFLGAVAKVQGWFSIGK